MAVLHLPSRTAPRRSGGPRTDRGVCHPRLGYRRDAGPRGPAGVSDRQAELVRASAAPHRNMLALYRRLIELRRTEPDLQDPRLTAVAVDYDEPARWLVVHRGGLRIAANFDEAPQVVPGLAGQVVSPPGGQGRRQRPLARWAERSRHPSRLTAPHSWGGTAFAARRSSAGWARLTIALSMSSRRVPPGFADAGAPRRPAAGLPWSPRPGSRRLRWWSVPPRGTQVRPRPEDRCRPWATGRGHHRCRRMPGHGAVHHLGHATAAAAGRLAARISRGAGGDRRAHHRGGRAGPYPPRHGRRRARRRCCGFGDGSMRSPRRNGSRADRSLGEHQPRPGREHRGACPLVVGDRAGRRGRVQRAGVPGLSRRWDAVDAAAISVGPRSGRAGGAAMTPEHPTPSGWIDLEITATDPTAGGSGIHHRRAPAASPRPVSGRTVVVAVTVASLALAVAILGLLIRSRTVTTTTHIQAVVPRGVDASGCPVGRTCRVSSNPESAVLGAVDRALDFPTVIGSVTVSDAPTNVHLPHDAHRSRQRGGHRHDNGPVRPRRISCAGAVKRARRNRTGRRSRRRCGCAGLQCGCGRPRPADAPVPVQAIEHIAHDPSAQLHVGR